MPLDVDNGLELVDVCSQSSKLTSACTTAASTTMLSGGPEVLIVLCVWQLQTRVLFDWKRPTEFAICGISAAGAPWGTVQRTYKAYNALDRCHNTASCCDGLHLATTPRRSARQG